MQPCRYYPFLCVCVYMYTDAFKLNTSPNMRLPNARRKFILSVRCSKSWASSENKFSSLPAYFLEPETRQPTLRLHFIEKSEPTILLLSSMLESWKKMPFNMNIHKQGLSSVLCPDVIKDLRESFPVCAQQQSPRAKRVCQYESECLFLLM